MFYKKSNSMSEFNVHTFVEFNNTVMRASHSTDLQLSQGEVKVVRHIYSITVVQKVLVLHTKAIFFSVRIISWGGNESMKYFRNPYVLSFPKTLS